MKTISNFPKYYLADVPQSLRRQLLDMCYAQQRPAALELLSQNGFHHYDDLDLQAFYGYAPTNLPEPPDAATTIQPPISDAPPIPSGSVLPPDDIASASLADSSTPAVPEPPGDSAAIAGGEPSARDPAHAGRHGRSNC